MTWSIEKSDEFYGISRWGENFFGVNQKGELSVYPERNNRSIQISIADVVKEMKDQHISFPAVIRFQDVLRSRVKDLNKAFKSPLMNIIIVPTIVVFTPSKSIKCEKLWKK